MPDTSITVLVPEGFTVMGFVAVGLPLMSVFAQEPPAWLVERHGQSVKKQVFEVLAETETTVIPWTSVMVAAPGLPLKLLTVMSFFVPNVSFRQVTNSVQTLENDWNVVPLARISIQDVPLQSTP